jgi:hypothetical protein
MLDDPVDRDDDLPPFLSKRKMSKRQTMVNKTLHKTVTSRTGTTYPSEAYEFILVLMGFLLLTRSTRRVTLVDRKLENLS